jgi:hypothetical protein
MGFLKKLFGGDANATQDGGIYVYIRLARSAEIVRLRIDPAHELNASDDGGFITRKHIIGPRSFQRAEAVFMFSDAKHLLNTEVDGGEAVTEEEWLAQESQSRT